VPSPVTAAVTSNSTHRGALPHDHDAQAVPAAPAACGRPAPAVGPPAPRPVAVVSDLNGEPVVLIAEGYGRRGRAGVAEHVREICEIVGISRNTYYKYTRMGVDDRSAEPKQRVPQAYVDLSALKPDTDMIGDSAHLLGDSNVVSGLIPPLLSALQLRLFPIKRNELVAILLAIGPERRRIDRGNRHL
jgi:hypothetical protein